MDVAAAHDPLEHREAGAAPSGGPLAGLRIIEIAGAGPGPFAAMMLADLGADVIRIDRSDRVGTGGGPTWQKAAPNLLTRSRQSMAVDLKHPRGVETILRMLDNSHALIEGFRPGVMERLGLGPDVCLARNERLVYARITGWGQEGPYSQMPGHDVNYTALAGALAAIGPRHGPPVPPLALVGDFGGGGMLLALGVMCGIYSAAQSGRGQVVDASAIDGVAVLMTPFQGALAAGQWNLERGSNIVDGGAPFYGVYECSDGLYISIGCLEAEFYSRLLELLEIDESQLSAQFDQSGWPGMRERFQEVFITKARDEWCALMEHTDVCFAPLLSMAEAFTHPHHLARRTFVEIDGVLQSNASPRFSRTPGSVKSASTVPGQHTDEVLQNVGFTGQEIEELRKVGAIA